MASPTQWTWVWVNSGSWWWTGRPGVLQFMGSLRVRHDGVNWTELCYLEWAIFSYFFVCLLISCWKLGINYYNTVNLWKSDSPHTHAPMHNWICFKLLKTVVVFFFWDFFKLFLQILLLVCDHWSVCVLLACVWQMFMLTSLNVESLIGCLLQCCKP